jgi:cell division septal protein FtsQ
MTAKGKDVLSVEELIAQRKSDKRRRTIRKIQLVTVFFLFTSLLGTGFYLYFSSAQAKTNLILISGTKILDDDYVLRLSQSGYDSFFMVQNVALMRKNATKEPLIQDVKVTLDSGNTIRIQVSEKAVIAIWMDEAKMVLGDGSLLPMKDEYAKAWLQAPGIYGYTDLATLGLLVDALKTIQREALGSVSEIHLAPTAYDENYVKVIMQDGNKIFTSLKTLSLIEAYPSIVNELKAANACIFFDEMTRTAYSQPCEK